MRRLGIGKATIFEWLVPYVFASRLIINAMQKLERQFYVGIKHVNKYI